MVAKINPMELEQYMKCEKTLDDDEDSENIENLLNSKGEVQDTPVGHGAA